MAIKSVMNDDYSSYEHTYGSYRLMVPPPSRMLVTETLARNARTLVSKLERHGLAHISEERMIRRLMGLKKDTFEDDEMEFRSREFRVHALHKIMKISAHLLNAYGCADNIDIESDEFLRRFENALRDGTTPKETVATTKSATTFSGIFN